MISYKKHWLELINSQLQKIVSFFQKIDLFKSLVVLWIVNTVNELIHLRHIIHQNPLYVPICP